MPTIDPTHTPFKRTKKLGPGPRKRPPVYKAADWECVARPKTKKHYVTVCRYVGDDRSQRGKKRVIKLKRGWKKGYNRTYRAWAKKHRIALQNRGRISGYKCRSTARSRC